MVKIGREWNDDLNWRPGEATRRKQSIFRWKGRGVVRGYLKVQGGSPCLCKLRTVSSEALSDHLIMY
jgi:hypothetical protein